MPARVDAIGCGFAGSPGPGPEVAAVALEFGNDITGWIVTGRMSLERRRCTMVFCDTASFTVVEAAGTTTLTEFDVGLTRRDQTHARSSLTEGTIRLTSTDRPLTLALEHFVNGVQRGLTRYFGTALAVAVVGVLARADQARALRGSGPAR